MRGMARVVVSAGVILVGIMSGLAAEQPAAASSEVSSGQKPWFDGQLRAFFAAKSKQAHQLADQEGQPIPAEVWSYFEAGSKGDWATATNVGAKLCQTRREASGSGKDKRLCESAVWAPVMETVMAAEQFATWSRGSVLSFGDEIIKSIPPGSIYFGGTDPGRGLVTAMSRSHIEGKPFFTLTQNALADQAYLRYLRAMYGAKIYIPTGQDFTNVFTAYVQGAEKRAAEHKLKPGEDVKSVDGNIQVSGQVAVMEVNGELARVIFDKNPHREFYIEESFPLDWMYPYLTPHGLVLKLNRQPLERLDERSLSQDHQFWSRFVNSRMGDWLDSNTPLTTVAAFIEKVYVRQDLNGFHGDRQYTQDTDAQKAFSKLRSSIGGVYNWRLNQARTPAERERMSKEADFAFRQALVLCPGSPEAVYRYVNLLLGAQRYEDALLVAATGEKVDPQNGQLESLVKSIKALQNRKPAEAKAGDTL